MLYIALWFVPDYEYTWESQDYITGVRDEGFVERRIHDVHIEWPYPSGVTSAELITLDASPPTSLRLDYPVDGCAQLYQVPIGEMPILIRLSTRCVPLTGLGDWNGDGRVNLFDMSQFENCLSGPGGMSPDETCSEVFDLNYDGKVDWVDRRLMRELYGH